MMETWHAMEALVTSGLVKAIGLSNYNSIQVSDVYSRGDSDVIVEVIVEFSDVIVEVIVEVSVVIVEEIVR